MPFKRALIRFYIKKLHNRVNSLQHFREFMYVETNNRSHVCESTNQIFYLLDKFHPEVREPM